MKLSLTPSPRQDKRFRMTFYLHDIEQKHTDFGAPGPNTFIDHQDEKRKNNFLNRFSKLIQQEEHDMTSPITLSKYLLWNKPTLEASLKDYKQHFQKTNFS